MIDGVFEFRVNRPSDRPLAGKVVRFRVGGLETSARAVWEAGKETELNIRVVQALQTPVRIPRRQVARVVDADQDTGEVQDIQRKIQELTQDRDKAKTNLQEQVNSKLTALDDAINQRKKDLRVAAGEELDAVVQKVEDAVNRPRLNPLNPQQVKRLESEVDSTETDLRKDFDEKMRLLNQERADRERELIRLANGELDDLDRRIEEMKLELERRIGGQDSTDEKSTDEKSADDRRKQDRPVLAVQSQDDEPVAAAASDTAGPGPDETVAERKGNSSSRGFFFNSVSGNVSGIDESLDPTTIAVLGILITLVATTIQLVKGN